MNEELEMARPSSLINDRAATKAEHDVRVLEAQLASKQIIVEKIDLHLSKHMSTNAHERLVALGHLLRLTRNRLRAQREEH